jgi:hypothetical protein
LECGHELPQKRRAGVRPVVGIATTLTVLVGAAAAAGFTLVQDGKQPPPPPTTVAQVPPPVTTPPPADTTTTPPPVNVPNDVGAPRAPRAGRSLRTGGGGGGAPTSGGAPTTGGTPATPSASDVPDLSGDVDTSTPNPPPPSDDAPDVDSGNSDGGSVQDEGTGDGTRRRAATPRPRLVPTNVALGSVAVVYSAVASDADPGDPGAVTDGSSSTAWKTPVYPDPTTPPETGVYVDLAGVDSLTRLVVDTRTPGMTFEVYAAKSGPPQQITGAGWTHVATKQDVGATTQIRFEGQSFRYVLVWITGLPAGRDQAAISELNVFSKQPQ